MKRFFSFQLFALLAFASFALLECRAQDSKPEAAPELEKAGSAFFINLAAVLRLAHAQNLDIQIAREKITEAAANLDSAYWQFFPSLSPGISYRSHDGLIQDVAGNLLNVRKQSYSPGATLSAQVDLGDAIYKSLAVKQQLKASQFAAESQRQQTVCLAAQNYFDLLLSQSGIQVATEAVKISTNYAAELKQAVEAGVAFAGDQLREEVEAQRNQLSVQQAWEKYHAASARLAQTLRMEPGLEFQAMESELAPFRLTDTNAPLSALIAEAQVARAETRELAAGIEGARALKKSAVIGPMIPIIGAQFYGGGLGGSSSAGPSRFGDSEYYFLGLSWRIGPGGLFDTTRTRAAESRLKSAELNSEKLKVEITRQVTDAFWRVKSITAQLETARAGLEAARKVMKLMEGRREFSVGIVLENIQAAQELTRARGDYLKSISEFNKAQYQLLWALGKL